MSLLIRKFMALRNSSVEIVPSAQAPAITLIHSGTVSAANAFWVLKDIPTKRLAMDITNMIPAVFNPLFFFFSKSIETTSCT